MPEDLTVMVVEAGARGDILSEAYEKSTQVKNIVVVPGNRLHYRTDIGWRDIDRFLEQKPEIILQKIIS